MVCELASFLLCRVPPKAHALASSFLTPTSAPGATSSLVSGLLFSTASTAASGAAGCACSFVACFGSDPEVAPSWEAPLQDLQAGARGRGKGASDSNTTLPCPPLLSCTIGSLPSTLCVWQTCLCLASLRSHLSPCLFCSPASYGSPSELQWCSRLRVLPDPMALAHASCSRPPRSVCRALHFGGFSSLLPYIYIYIYFFFSENGPVILRSSQPSGLPILHHRKGALTREHNSTMAHGSFLA